MNGSNTPRGVFFIKRLWIRTILLRSQTFDENNITKWVPDRLNYYKSTYLLSLTFPVKSPSVQITKLIIYHRKRWVTLRTEPKKTKHNNFMYETLRTCSIHSHNWNFPKHHSKAFSFLWTYAQCLRYLSIFWQIVALA